MPRLTKEREYLRDFWHGLPQGKGVDADVGNALIATADLIEDVNRPRLEAMRSNTALYRDRDCNGFDSGNLRLHSTAKDVLTYNVVKSCTDTVIAKLGLHEPSPNVSTFGADEELQEKARGMEKLTVGVLQNQNGWHEGLTALKDGCLCPVGVVKIFDDGDQILVRRRHPSKVLWDVEGAVDARRPSVFYEIDTVGRVDLIRQYPSFASDLRDVPHVSDKGVSGGKKVRDMVRVVEGFKEGRPGAIGRRTVAVSGLTLLDEPWDGEAPYEFVRWTDDLIGFDGLSIAHELAGIQGEINFVLECLAGNHEMFAVSYYLKHRGSEVDDEAFLTNRRFRKVEHIGDAPEIIHPPIANQQVFDYLERLYTRSFEMVGLSQLSATSKKPADLESGAALRAYLDVETVRFSVAQKSWENLFVGLAKQIIRCARRLATKKPDWAARYVGKDRLLQKIKWADVALEDDQFQVRIYPISALPLQPSARLSRAAELARDQLITPMQFQVLADMPDLEKQQRLAVAPYEDLERIFESMLKQSGKYIPPLEFQALEIGIPLCASYWSRAACDGVPQPVLDRLEKWMVDAKELQQHKLEGQLALRQLEAQLQQAMQAAQAAQAPVAPPAPAGAPPESGPPPGGPPPGEQLAA